MDPYVARVIDSLERTPGVLEALFRDSSDDWRGTREGEGTFSPEDVLAHLLHGEEEDWMVRLGLILEHGEARTFEPFDRVRFRTLYAGEDAESKLERFTSMRVSNLEALKALGLDGAALERTGTHPEFGAVSARQLLGAWVAHDLGHLAQIVRVAAKAWTEDVGPWRRYMPVLEDRRA